MKYQLFIRAQTFAIAALAFGAFANIAIAETFDPNVAITKPAKALKFDNITPSLQFSDASGDRANTAHGRFAVISGNWDTSSHIHSAANHGVVVRGVVTNGFDGDKNPPRLGPGSYWYVSANAVHTTACLSKEPCLT